MNFDLTLEQMRMLLKELTVGPIGSLLSSQTGRDTNFMCSQVKSRSSEYIYRMHVNAW